MHPAQPTPAQPASSAATGSIHQQLADNAHRSARQGIRIRVDSINAGHDVAFCSVEQRKHGLFHRRRTVPELTWRAEQALAPLIGLDILPLITVHHKDHRNERARRSVSFTRWLMDGIQVLAGRLGVSWRHETFSPLPVPADPFGWRQALRASALN